MPTGSLHRAFPESHKAPKKYVLVLSCVDARLLDDLVRFLDHDNLTNRYYHVTLPGASLGLTDRWVEDDPNKLDDRQTAERLVEQRSRSDAGKTEIPKEPCYCIKLDQLFPRWRQTFIDQVQAAFILTKGTLDDVYIVQHEDCGAFREYIKKDSANMTRECEISLHKEYASKLAKDMNDRFDCDYIVRDSANNPAQKKPPKVHTFYMDLRGHVIDLSRWSDLPDECDTKSLDSGSQQPAAKKAAKKSVGDRKKRGR